MSKTFRDGERIKIIKGQLMGNEGVVRHCDAHGVVHVTLDRRVSITFQGVDRKINRIGIQEANLESLEPDEIHGETEIVLEEEAPPVAQRAPILTLHEAYRFELESKRPKYSGQGAIWKAQDLCPQCGEKGRYSHGSPVCTKHGVY